MLLVGLENCKPCIELHKKFPSIPFVEVPREAGKADKDIFEVKKAIGQLGITEFPVLLNDSLNKVLPLTLLEPLAK